MAPRRHIFAARCRDLNGRTPSRRLAHSWPDRFQLPVNQYTSDDEFDFVPARFPVRLNLPSASPQRLVDAQEAVKREFRDSVKWKRLRCRRVEILSKTEGGTIFELQIGHSVEFDWTWEGAVAFRPLVLKEDTNEQKSLFDQDRDEPEIDDSTLWRGEILEVDEATGRIFVCVSDPEHPPRKGSFYVRPFEFLGILNAVFNEPAFDKVRHHLPGRLLATEGGVHPDVAEYAPVGLPHLSKWWSKSWSVLWGAVHENMSSCSPAERRWKNPTFVRCSSILRPECFASEITSSFGKKCQSELNTHLPAENPSPIQT